ncbi:hypothetical protein HN388_05075 [bacterium]|jgi:hypothetical protein|nr:hypothetical protein [bacterium]MBT7310501.1 hypothetical protein [bacterium]
MSNHIDVLLLNALPASGKSEARTYLASLSAEECEKQFGIGHTVQLDDYPYVHLMRCISQELRALGLDGGFFDADHLPMKQPLDWGTLMELLNEDYHDMINGRRPAPVDPSSWLLDRYDVCRERVGAPAQFRDLSADNRSKLEDAIRDEAAKLLKDKVAEVPDSMEGKTVVVEFARGGADKSEMPLNDPFGYKYSYRMLCPEMLERSSILYIWVSPEESRRKNDHRTDPNDPGSILNHGVPIEVMLGDYGCDDMAHLLETSEKENTVTVEAHGKTYHLPLGRFDNRVDLTTFIRDDLGHWQQEDMEKLQAGMREAFNQIFSQL